MVVKNGKEQPSWRRDLLLGGALTLLSLAALAAWYFMPIYPDEIALRLQTGRHIQDQGVIQGLYALCTSNIRETPLLFVIPAWILSWLDLTLSPVDVRALPFVTVLTAVLLAVWFAVRQVSPNAAMVATTAFIGVAGSGLVMARHEYVQILNIVCCLCAFHYLESTSPRPSLRYGLFVLLLASSLLSIYVHIQGLLFLPLTLYLAYSIVIPSLGKPYSALLMVILLVFITLITIRSHFLICVGYPEIEQLWVDRVFRLDELESIKLTDWLAIKFDKYLVSFQYTENYAINYLPGINGGDGWQQKFLATLNQSIQIILLANLLLSAFLAVGVAISAVKQYQVRYQLTATSLKTGLGCHRAFALGLLTLPVIFLFFYDNAQNFYRSFFLNFLIAILLAQSLSLVSLHRVRILANLYFGACLAVVIASLIVNVWWFTNRLRAGYEGPSIALSRDWNGINRDVEVLVKACNIDVRKGRIVLDDMTYDSLKRSPILYPITYLSLQADVAKIDMNEVISRVRPNYALARCGSMQGTNVGFSRQSGELCCLNFLEAGAGK